MLNTPEVEKDWLEQLQKELIEDRIKETGNASPLFYTIHDYKDVVTAEGYEDGYQFYHSDTCDTYDTIEDILREEDEDNLKQWAEDYEDSIGFDEEGNPYIIDKDNCIDMLEQEGYTIVYTQSVPFVVPNTLFLTRKEAKKHFDANDYHYTSKASTYAMTAWRSPQYEHLIELLHNIDWKNSHIEFRIPNNWVKIDYLQALLKAYLTINQIETDAIDIIIDQTFQLAYQKNYIRQNKEDNSSWFHPSTVGLLQKVIQEFLTKEKYPSFADIYPCCLPKDVYQLLENKIPTQPIHYVKTLDYRYEEPRHTLVLHAEPNENSTEMTISVEIWKNNKCHCSWQGTTLPEVLHMEYHHEALDMYDKYNIYFYSN